MTRTERDRPAALAASKASQVKAKRENDKFTSVTLAGYEVTRDGRIVSTTNWRGMGTRELAQQPNDDGYPSVRVTIAGKRVRYAVHSLVALAHLPPRPSPAHEVRHLDGNKLNPHADNLAWGTRKENADDRELHGRTSRGARHSAFIKASNQAERARAYSLAKKEARDAI